MAQWRPGDEEEGAGGQEYDDRRSHVRFGDDESADDPQKQDERHEPERELIDVRPAAGQPGSDVDNHRQLGKLARLNRDRPEDEPAGRSIPLDAWAGQQDRNQPQKRQQEHRHAPGAQPVVVHAHEHN